VSRYVNKTIVEFENLEIPLPWPVAQAGIPANGQPPPGPGGLVALTTV